MITSNKILVPVDFNEKSMNVLNYAANMAKKYNLEIYLLYVIEESGFFTKFFSLDDHQKMADQLEQKLQTIANDVSKNKGVIINPMLARGPITTKINEIAQLLDVACIVVGISNHSEEENVLGKITHKLLHTATHPVMVIRNSNSELQVNNILLPLDLVPASREVVPEIVALAKITKAKITLLAGVWEHGDESMEMQNKMQFILNQVQDFINQEGIQCEGTYLGLLDSEDEFRKKICEYSKEIKADIVVATGAAKSSPNYYVKKDAYYLLHNSPAPILSIISEEKGIISATGRI